MHRNKIKEIQNEIGDKNHEYTLIFVKDMFECLTNQDMAPQYKLFLYICFFFFCYITNVWAYCKLFYY